MEDGTVKLLTEIRDLLVPMSEAARPEYEKVLRERHQRAIESIIRIVGRSRKQIRAAKMMDGAMTGTQIRAATAFDSANFSKFVKKLRDADALTSAEQKLALVVPVEVIPWPVEGDE